MGWAANTIRSMRPGRGRAGPVLALLGVAIALLAFGCGGESGGGGSIDTDKAADLEILNVALSQELTMIDVYSEVLPRLEGQSRAVARQFRAQEQEHVNGLTKAIRGLGGEREGEAEEVDLSDLKSERDTLLRLYEMTSLQLTHFLDDVTHLTMRAPQSFAASMAANEAQHLVVFRRLLGAGLLESVPEAFDTGEVPPPEQDRAADAPGSKG